VDAVFDKLTMMSAAELRELAGSLPAARWQRPQFAATANYLPKQVDTKNAKYILGPVALDRIGSPLPTPMVDFKSGAEVVIARYQAKIGESSLMLIEYPTPQLAPKNCARWMPRTNPPRSARQALRPSWTCRRFFDRRTGPIIVVAAGPLAISEANALLGSVSYEADVTWNENTTFRKKTISANLLFNVIVLCGIVVACRWSPDSHLAASVSS